MTYGENEKLRAYIDQLIKEASNLLSAIIQKTKSSDIRSKVHGSRWVERHRLHVLLDAAERDKRRNKMSGVIILSWFVAELAVILETIRRWRKDPLWREIEPSLVNPTHFTHTVLKLCLADCLKNVGHEVAIIPESGSASPDLKVQAIGGSQDWIHIECYQPKALANGSMISSEEIERIVKKSMDKARRQLQDKVPGILAICGYNQTKTNFGNLRQKIENRLSKTTRPSLCGVLLTTFDIDEKIGKSEASLMPKLNFDFIPNPSYFGRVGIDTSMLQSSARSATKPITKSTRLERLSLIEEPRPMTRVIEYAEDQSLLPFYKGEGNIDYVCGQCGTMLVESVWKFSISNIVVKCPSCQSYNEFPRLKDIEHLRLGTIGMVKNRYRSDGTVRLKRGICIVGLDIGVDEYVQYRSDRYR